MLGNSFMIGDKWFKDRWLEFTPISYVGLILVIASVAFKSFYQGNNAYIMVAPVIVVFIGIYLIFKGRKKRGTWN